MKPSDHLTDFVRDALRAGQPRAEITRAITAAGWSEREAEEALNKEFRADALMDLRINPANMIADLHGSKEYRAHLVSVMTKRAVEACM